MSPRTPSDGPTLARVHHAWEGLIRPTLRAHAAHLEATRGTRPRPCDLFVVFGIADDVQIFVTLALDPSRAQEAVALVGPRAHPEDLVQPAIAQVVRSLLASFSPDETPIVWVGADGVDAVGIDVVDTGPEGDRVNAVGGVA